MKGLWQLHSLHRYCFHRDLIDANSVWPWPPMQPGIRGHPVNVLMQRRGTFPYLCESLSTCSNQRYSWVTCVILSNFCNFSKLVLSTHPLFLYQFLLPYQTFVIFSPLVIYSLLTLSTHPIIAPGVNTTNTTLTLVVSSTRSLRQYTFPNSTGVFGHRAILIRGIEAWLGGFLLEQAHTL